MLSGKSSLNYVKNLKTSQATESDTKRSYVNSSRAESYSTNGKHGSAKTFYRKSESLCENALEILQEILHYDSKFRVWFDRDISYEVGGGLSADILSVPRLVTSRSHEMLRDDNRLTSKKRVEVAVSGRASNTQHWQRPSSSI